MKENFYSLLAILKAFLGIIALVILVITVFSLLIMFTWNISIANLIEVGFMSLKTAVLIAIILVLSYIAK